MTEKDVNQKEKEHSEEIDPKLKELIEIMKLIQKEMPNADPSERITVFLRYLEEQKHNNFGTEKQNSTNPVNIETLLKSLSFKKSKNGKSEFATIDQKTAQTLPQEFETQDEKFFVKKDSKNPVIIKLKKKASQ